MYCVAPLKEYTEEVTIPTPPPPEPVKTRKWDIVFISAFAGSALGSLIISLIFAFI